MAEIGDEINAGLEEEAPELFGCLSPLGRAAFFPPDIPVQAEQARGKAFNATIGQITDGAGQALGLPSITLALTGLAPEERNRALLYSPPAGLPRLREAWRRWQRREGVQEKPSSLPLVTTGLTHGLSVAADLFAQKGTPVAVPAPFWGNYRQTFELRREARILSAPAYREGRYNPGAIAEALSDEPQGRAAIAILNIPSNPGGYSPTGPEREALVESLLGVAETRPLVVLCDDAYAGLVYEEGVPARSVFWDLVGRHERLIPLKVDGATKEFSFFGGRVGFITFPFQPDSLAALALENKAKSLVRSTVGSPSATSQVLLLRALESSPAEAEVAAVRDRLAGRYRALKHALGQADQSLMRPLPFNSGCFALVEIPEELAIDSDQARLHLLGRQDTGLVSVAPNFLRIAFCSVDRASLPELVSRVEQGLGELAG